jgi:hypothetical protein
MHYCSNCGGIVAAGAASCPHCRGQFQGRGVGSEAGRRAVQDRNAELSQWVKQRDAERAREARRRNARIPKDTTEKYRSQLRLMELFCGCLLSAQPELAKAHPGEFETVAAFVNSRHQDSESIRNAANAAVTLYEAADRGYCATAESIQRFEMAKALLSEVKKLQTFSDETNYYSLIMFLGLILVAVAGAVTAIFLPWKQVEELGNGAMAIVVVLACGVPIVVWVWKAVARFFGSIPYYDPHNRY